MKKISILGSTGSIGTQTLEVVRENIDKFEIIGLTCNSNIELILSQIKEFKPKIVCVMNEKKAKELEKLISSKIEIVTNIEGLIKVATNSENDIVVTAVVGSIGLVPTYEAVKLGIDIALANKETLVTAGEIIMKEAKKSGSKILPVDSEHSAIFQSLLGNKHKEIDKLILTASGGAFLNKTIEELKDVKVKDALKHPNWEMGRKITIDSATMMNKGLEVIEAKWLFDIDIENIDVVIHPQSIIHSMVQYIDSSVIAQMGLPDMKLPIVFALNYPDRKVNNYERLDLTKIQSLTFYKPDLDKYKPLSLAYRAIRIGGTMPVVLNTANEIYVNKFLNDEIDFLDIANYVENAMNNHKVINNPSLEDILMLEKVLREKLS
ncbi:1-deoxy-D-xylulose-5-phosphate reductoisomerase [Clostridiaceae bacterium HSG29]|nr:1-deoxy-D-xylulose-5-phosphate reductoisomerase [Clostridiaceae bacterium HSG29]